jgi:hypothetical protein
LFYCPYCQVYNEGFEELQDGDAGKRKEKRMKRVQTQLAFLDCLALVFVADLLRNVKLTILPWARIPTTHLLLTATMEDKTMLSAPVVSPA